MPKKCQHKDNPKENGKFIKILKEIGLFLELDTLILTVIQKNNIVQIQSHKGKLALPDITSQKG